MIITTFTGLALTLLVVTQVFFLDALYQHIKLRSIRNAAEEIAQAVGSQELFEHMAYWHAKEQLDILIVNENGDVLLREMSDAMENSRFDRASLREVFEEAVANGGTYHLQDSVELSLPDGEQPPKDMPDGPPDKEPPRKPNRPKTAEQLVYAQVTRAVDTDEAYMVLIHATLSPVSATVRTMAFQFVIAILVLVAMSIVISYLIAKKFAKPIIELNTAAKGLATGKYQTPQTGGYREVEELMTTLEMASDDLKRSEQLQRELFANVSHDLRTPLTMITGYSEAIRDLPGEDSADNIQVVIDEANRLTRLVDDVLDLTKLRAGVQALETTRLDLSQIVSDMTARCHCLAEPDGYRLTYAGDEHVMVDADELRLSQALYNLLSNALAHAGEDKTVEVTLKRVGDRARVSVTDHGRGIPKEEQEAIWRRYYSVSCNTGVDGMRHTGLGLSIVRAVVERHGGECGVTSEQGMGSTFWFDLPCADV